MLLLWSHDTFNFARTLLYAMCIFFLYWNKSQGREQFFSFFFHVYVLLYTFVFKTYTQQKYKKSTTRAIGICCAYEQCKHLQLCIILASCFVNRPNWVANKCWKKLVIETKESISDAVTLTIDKGTEVILSLSVCVRRGIEKVCTG